MNLTDLSSQLRGRPPDESRSNPIVLERPNNSESIVYDAQAWTLRVSGSAGSSDGIEYSVGNGELFHVVFSLEDDVDLQYGKMTDGTVQGEFKEVLGAIIPQGMRYRLWAHGGTSYQYVAKPSGESESNLSIDTPVAFRKDHLIQVLRERRPNPYKIVIPSLWEGDIPVKGGEVMNTRKGTRPVLLGTKGHGFSVADSYSKQDFHYHHELSEIFIGKDKTTLVWRTGADLSEREASAGKVIIIPPLTPHGVELTGDLHFVLQGSRAENYTLATDKVSILKIK